MLLIVVLNGRGFCWEGRDAKLLVRFDMVDIFDMFDSSEILLVGKECHKRSELMSANVIIEFFCEKKKERQR